VRATPAISNAISSMGGALNRLDFLDFFEYSR
jgi:hypothetical protein